MSGRNSIGVERAPGLGPIMRKRFEEAVELGQKRTHARYAAHAEFVADRIRRKRPPKHMHHPLALPVVTAQETDLQLCYPTELEQAGFQRWQVTLKAFDPSTDEA